VFRFVHDLRESIHKTLNERTIEYLQRQKEVLEQTKVIQMRKENPDSSDDDDIDDEAKLRRSDTEFFDADDA
jgi:hypothetical protein